MEPRKTTDFDRRTQFTEFESLDRDRELTEKRLNSLLTTNANFAKENSCLGSHKEQIEADMLEHPISTERAFSYFGLLLGLLPPAALFGRFLYEADTIDKGAGWVIGLLLVVNLVSGVTGYFSGKLVSKAIVGLEQQSWLTMLLLTPFLGLLWGILAGGVGGFFFFIIGAFFGAGIGGIVGAAALPVFSVFHRMFKKGDKIERDTFIPVAFGITLAISALILGFPG